MSAAGTDIVDHRDSNNTIFTMKGTKLYFPLVTLSARDKQKAKDWKDQFIGVSKKQIVMIKTRQLNLDIFSNKTLLESINYLF